jgi:hypothetical protein
MFAGGMPALLYLTPGFGSSIQMRHKAGGGAGVSVAPEFLAPEFLDSHTRIR